MLGVDGEAEAADVGGGELLVETPGRALGPVPHGLAGPSGGLVRMAGRACIWNLVLVRHRRRDKREGMGAYENTGDRNFDLRHVTRYAFAARGAVFVVRVRSQC